MSKEIKTLAQFKKLKCCKPIWDDYTPPTGEEVGRFLELTEWTHEQVAAMLGLNLEVRPTGYKRCMSINNWKAGRKKIDYTRWHLMLAYAGVVDLNSEKTKIL